MKVAFSNLSVRQYHDLTPQAKAKFDKQLGFLLHDLHFPSLLAEKYEKDIWQARVDRRYRFYFKIEGDTYHILL